MAVVLNLDKLINKLDTLKKAEFEQTLNKACLLVENDAKRKCPVDTGQLIASISHEIDDGVGVIGTNVEYAP